MIMVRYLSSMKWFGCDSNMLVMDLALSCDILSMQMIRWLSKKVRAICSHFRASVTSIDFCFFNASLFSICDNMHI